ncbi:MAG: hypothetical protein WBJ52_03190 [Methanoregulaceae archaeon]
METLRIVLLDNAGRVAWDRSCYSGADRSVVSIIQAADGSFAVMGNVCRFLKDIPWRLQCKTPVTLNPTRGRGRGRYIMSGTFPIGKVDERE